MKRRAKKLPIENVVRQLGVSDPTRCELYVDELSQEDIEAVVRARYKKFRRILYQVYKFQYNDELYRLEQKNDKQIIDRISAYGEQEYEFD